MTVCHFEVTTSKEDTCTTKFGGTSAAAPMAAGIIALALEANQNLTWRDIQYIIVRTAKSKGLTANYFETKGIEGALSEKKIFTVPDWDGNYGYEKFGARPYCRFFGFGLLDAGRMVKLAKKKWINVPSLLKCILTTFTERR